MRMLQGPQSHWLKQLEGITWPTNSHARRSSTETFVT